MKEFKTKYNTEVASLMTCNWSKRIKSFQLTILLLELLNVMFSIKPPFDFLVVLKGERERESTVPLPLTMNVDKLFILRLNHSISMNQPKRK